MKSMLIYNKGDSSMEEKSINPCFVHGSLPFDVTHLIPFDVFVNFVDQLGPKEVLFHHEKSLISIKMPYQFVYCGTLINISQSQHGGMYNLF